MRASGLVFAVFLLATPARADVLLVDDSGGASFASISAAVMAAADGDVILVQPGQYGGFTISGKALVVAGVGPTAQHVSVIGNVRVQNLAAGQQVLIERLWVLPPEGSGATDRDALRVTGNLGAVRVQEAYLQGARSVAQGGSPWVAGGRGVYVNACEDVQLVGVACVGGYGASDVPLGFGGGTGLHAQAARVALWDSEVGGGQGGGFGNESYDFGGEGGPGVVLQAAELFAAKTAIGGGQGGFAAFTSAPGGDGLVVDAASVATLREVELDGGDGGWDMGITIMGPPGAPLASTGVVVTIPGHVPSLGASDLLAGAGQSLQVVITGGPLALLLVSLEPGWDLLPAHGLLAVAGPWLLQPPPVLPASFALSVPPLPAGLDTLPLHVQAAVPGAGLSWPLEIVLLPAGF